MGCACVPRYTNLYLSWWEDQVIFTGEKSLLVNHTMIWIRFFDNILLIWTSMIYEFKEFLVALNLNILGLKFS